MTAVWVTGGAGVLAQAVAKAVVAEFGGCALTDRHSCDIADPAQVQQAVRQIQPDVIINCAGIVRGRRVPPSEYVRTNSLAPHYLADAIEPWGGRLIQVSTDCVFSGRLPEYHEYAEDELPDPEDLYARTKLLGEIVRPPHLTVRASFIGVGQRGLLAWLMAQTGTVTGYDQAIWNGLTAPVLARQLAWLAGRPEVTGLLHLGGRVLSKATLLRKLAAAFGLPIEVSDGPTPPDRQRTLVLISNRDPEGMPETPDVDEMITELAAQFRKEQHQQTKPSVVVPGPGSMPNRAMRRLLGRGANR